MNVQNSPAYTMWSQDQIYELHLSSLEILEKIGVLIENEGIRKSLMNFGCIIKKDVVKIPASLVKSAIESAPERVVLANADNERTVYLQKNIVNYGLNDKLSLIYDSQTQIVRKAELSDIEKVARVVDTLENISIVSPLVSAQDLNKGTSELQSFKRMREYTKKPLMIKTPELRALRGMIEISTVLAGGQGEFRLNPSFIVVMESNTPLEINHRDIETIKTCAENNVPLAYVTTVIPGISAPETEAGAYALANAHFLATLVIHQMVKKSASYVHGIVLGHADKKVKLYGSPETAKSHFVSSSLARLYNIPMCGISGYSDSFFNGLQTAIEYTYSIQAAAYAGTNLAIGIGSCGLIANLESLIMANEIIGMTKHFMKGVDISDETVPLDLIHEVGPGGHFLMAEHTMKHFKSATWYPRYMNRQHFSSWEKEDGKDMGDKLSIKVREILNGNEKNGISEELLQMIERIIGEA